MNYERLSKKKADEQSTFITHTHTHTSQEETNFLGRHKELPNRIREVTVICSLGHRIGYFVGNILSF